MANLSLDIRSVSNKYDIPQNKIGEIFTLALKGINKRDLIAKTGLTRTQVNRVLSELSVYFEPPSQNVVLKSEFSKEIKSYNEGEKVAETKIFEIVEKYHSLRPKPDRKFDQFYATTDTVVRRAARLYESGDLQGRSIAFMGDDDLTSVAVALTKSAYRVSVFEIDPRIIKTIENANRDLGLNIEIVKCDLAQRLPIKFKGKFNTVFTDPPYTPSGMSSFINSGIDVLENRDTSKLYVCYGSGNSPERILKIQQIINEKGLRIVSLSPHFSEYRGAESIGNSSSLYELSLTSRTRQTETVGNMYTYE